MKKSILSLMITAILAVSGVPAAAFEAKDFVTYFGTTDESITVSWDENSPAPERYEVVLYHVERRTDGPSVSVVLPPIVLRLPRTGHYIAKIRACDGEDYSEWAESIDPAIAVVDGQPRGWWIYGHVAPPGTPIIGGKK